MATTSSGRRRRRRWVFGSAVLDESNWSLTVEGRPARLEGKALEVLHELLLRAGEVVTKDELLDTVWPGVTVVENSLATAVSKLRKALNDAPGAVIETVPRIGYRLAAVVSVEMVQAPTEPRFDFQPGDKAPGRGQWRLVEPLGRAGTADVWRARHDKTGQTRVFKYALAPDRLVALRREATLARLFMRSYGEGAPFVRLLEWNFETAPYFLESEDGGEDLLDWAERQGGLDRIPLDQRLALAADIARATAMAHRLGVLHKDLKPGNVLIETRSAGPFVRLADFGSGRLLDADTLRLHAITDMGVGAADALEGDRSGTAAYRAPELLSGETPTVRSDVYALGLILFQLVVGGFTRFPTPGWEREIDDPLLREDIAAAAAGDPDMRLESAGALAQRLATLDLRRRDRAQAEQDQARVAEILRRDERRRARRPAVLAATCVLIAATILTGAAATYAFHQRNQARDALRLTQASYDFLADDILGSPDPTRAASADESLTEAVKRAGAQIGVRFARDPLIAARLQASLARAFDMRSDYASAFGYYRAADGSYARAGQGASKAASINRLQWAAAEAISTQDGARAQARARIDRERRALDGGSPDPETMVWLETAEGQLALAAGDIPTADGHYAKAVELVAAAAPDAFTARQRLNFEQRHAFTQLGTGEIDEAARTFERLAARMAALQGADNPDTLLLRLNLAQVHVRQHRPDVAVAETAELLPLMQRRLGATHRYTLVTLAARQEALGQIGRYAEAAAIGERLWRAAAAKDGEGSFTALAGRTDTGISLCRAGRYEAGGAAVRAALDISRRTPGPESPLQQAMRAAIADCLIPAGRASEARPWLDGIDRTAVSQLVGDKDWGATIDLSLAEIAMAQGDRAEAARLMARARPPLAETSDGYVRRRIAAMDQRLGTAVPTS